MTLPLSDLEILWGVKIPMRDGVKLQATVYRPKGPAPTPLIVAVTPYIADSIHERGRYFSRHGYAFAAVDCRGRGNSGGTFIGHEQDAEEGVDTVSWLATQPWCDGRVAMWGGSYVGQNQWATIKDRPDALKTIVPAAAAHPGIDVPFAGQTALADEIRWSILVNSRTANRFLYDDEELWRERCYELYSHHLPFSTLDTLAGIPSQMIQEDIRHPPHDPYWKEQGLSPEQYRAIDIPILTITGHYDDDQAGALHYYRQHMRHGSPEAIARHFLVIGPWDHPGTRTPEREFGGLSFGEASLVDLNDLHRRWYDWVLTEGSRPEFLKDRVMYYVPGEERWRHAPSLEAMSDEIRTLFLRPNGGGAGDVFQAGGLSAEEPEESTPDSFIYNPLDLRPGELERGADPVSFTDQRWAMAIDGDALVYRSEAVAEEFVIAGFVKLVLFMSLDVPDTDFRVSLSEITADGGQILLGESFLRARYRNSRWRPEPAPEGEICRYVFEDFPFFARRVARGSRLRLVVRCVNSILYEKNYNTGGVIGEERVEDARVAHVTLYHDADHASRIELPLAADPLLQGE